MKQEGTEMLQRKKRGGGLGNMAYDGRGGSGGGGAEEMDFSARLPRLHQ